MYEDGYLIEIKRGEFKMVDLKKWIEIFRSTSSFAISISNKEQL